jgi:hypothetical protein
MKERDYQIKESSLTSLAITTTIGQLAATAKHLKLRRG